MDFKVTQIIKSIQQTSFQFKYKNRIINSKNEKQYILIEQDMILPDELSKIRKFFEALGIEDESNINLGVASYFNLEFSGHSPCFFGVLEDEKIGLFIGTDDGDSKSFFIKCQKEFNSKKKKFEYSINGHDLKLKEHFDNDGIPTGNLYLYLDCEFDSFSFPFLLKKEYKSEDKPKCKEIVKLFIDGDFHKCLRQFGASKSDNVYGQINKMFADFLESDTLPNNGIILILKNGILKEFPPNQYSQNGSIASTWELVDSSHPSLPCCHVQTDSGIKVISIIGLNKFSHINFPKSGKPTQELQLAGESSHSGLVAVLINGKNKMTKNPQHIPNHIYVGDSRYFDFIGIQNYPHLMQYAIGVEPLAITASLANDDYSMEELVINQEIAAF